MATLLQLIDVMNCCLAEPLLHFSPNSVINWAQMCTVGSHRVWYNEIGCLPFHKPDCFASSVCRNTVLLENKELARDNAYGTIRYDTIVCV